MRVKPSPLDDRTLTLKGGAAALARIAELLGAPTRLAVLDTLRVSPEPLHINEIARRVGVDASPVRTHLELLAKHGLVDEVEDGASRLRRFTTRVTDVRLILEGATRATPPPGRDDARKPKEVTRLERKLAGYAKQVNAIEEKAARVKREIAAAWSAVE